MRAILIVVGMCLVLGTGVLGAVPAERVKALPNAPPLPTATYAGYVPLAGQRQAFYYFTESQNVPSQDPLVVWFNGGPGCSSMEGNFVELGALTFNTSGQLSVNPNSWTTIANVLYIESPPGVGFSTDNPTNPTTYDDQLTATLNYQTLTTWLGTKFPEYIGHALYITGESYAGHYVPQLAYQILKGNATIRAMMRGFMVGNPCTGDIGCDGEDDPTLLPYLQYHGFAPLDPNTPTDDAGNYDPYDILVNTCANQHLARYARFRHPVLDSFRRRFKDVPPIDVCADNDIGNYLNRADVQQALNVQSTQWVECGGVNYNANPNGVTALYQTFFSETNWNILVYSGNADTVVNFAQTQTVLIGLNRTRLSGWSAWNFPSAKDGLQLGGFYVNYDRFSFATVDGAGHMVPQYQPAPALELFTSFLTTGRPGRR